MVINRKDISNYSDEFIKIIDEKIEYFKSMINSLNNREKPTYGYVPKKIVDSINGDDKYKKELDLLEMIKNEYLQFCNYDLSPFIFGDKLLNCISDLSATLTDKEKDELFLLLNNSINDINRRRVDDYLELESHLLYCTDSDNTFNFGQNLIEVASDQGVLPDVNAGEIISVIGKYKVDDYKISLGNVKSLFDKKNVPLGTYGIYKLINDIEDYIYSTDKEKTPDKFIKLIANFDYIKNCIIELERLSNCNDYLLSVLEMLKTYSEEELKGVIDYLSKMLEKNTDKYENLSNSIAIYPLEDLVTEVYKNNKYFER